MSATFRTGLVAIVVLVQRGMLASVVGAYYYLLIVKTMYFDEPHKSFEPMPGEQALVLGVAGLFNLLFFVYPAPLLDAATAAAKSLFDEYQRGADEIVRFAAAKPDGRKPIVLLGHMDVVDALTEDWVLPPFTLTEKDGFFFGRPLYQSWPAILAIKIRPALPSSFFRNEFVGHHGTI
jgi:hypothetical protein